MTQPWNNPEPEAPYRPPMPPAIEDEDVDYDFDVAWASHRRKGKRVRIRSKVYELPASMPAKLILFASQVRRTGTNLDKQMEPEKVIDLLGTLFGSENIDGLLASGMDISEMEDIMRYCMESYKERGQGKNGALAAGAAQITPSS